MLAACLAGVSYYFVCVDGYPKAGMIFTILLIFISLLDIISALYLGVSIYSIKKLITKRNLIIDTKIMIVQAVTFALYLINSIKMKSWFWPRKNRGFSFLRMFMPLN